MTALMAVLVVGVVSVVIAYPLFRPAPMAARESGADVEIAALQERKLQIYAAIRDVGFDYRTDKLEEQDYEEEVEGLKAQAVEVMKQIDELRQQSPRGPEALEQEIARMRDSRPEGATEADDEAAAPGVPAFCTQCGAAAGGSDKFCSACGNPLRTA